MRLGVAIPCYKHHIPLLKRCLDSIEAQTRKPDAVIVSCSSSFSEDIPSYTYSFPLQIIVSEVRQNAAKNRNIAAALLDTELISFFDCDDIMHPQRLEYIYKAFESYSCSIVLHSYFDGEEENKAPFVLYEECTMISNKLCRAPSGCAIIDGFTRIHHSQNSVKKEILGIIQFKEDTGHERKEDAVFCGDVLALPEIQSVYISNNLSKYYISGSWVE